MEFIILVYLFIFDCNDLGYHFFVSTVEIMLNLLNRLKDVNLNK